MASILILTKAKRGLSLANRLAREDNLVKITHEVPEPFSHPNLASLYNPTGLIDQFDLCLCLHHDLGDIAELAIENKVPTLGGCKFLVKYNNDADFRNRANNLLYKELKPYDESDYVETWFNTENFILPFKVKAQHRLMEGERGPLLGMTLFSYEGIKEPLEPPLELDLAKEFLNKINYLGPTLGPLPLGLTPTFLTFLEGCYKVFPTLMSFIHRNEVTLREELALGVRVTFPTLVDLSVDKEVLRHVDWFDDNTLYVTARGDSLRECGRRVNRTLKELDLSPEVMYRGDYEKCLT